MRVKVKNAHLLCTIIENRREDKVPGLRDRLVKVQTLVMYNPTAGHLFNPLPSIGIHLSAQVVSGRAVG